MSLLHFFESGITGGELKIQIHTPTLPRCRVTNLQLQGPFDILAVIPMDSLSRDIFIKSVTTQFTA